MQACDEGGAACDYGMKLVAIGTPGAGCTADAACTEEGTLVLGKKPICCDQIRGMYEGACAISTTSPKLAQVRFA